MNQQRCKGANANMKKRTKPTTSKRATTATKKAGQRTKTTIKRNAQRPTEERTPLAELPVTKKDAVLRLLQREDGATLPEVMTATGWQAHSVRGFISGTLRKKLGLTIERVKCNDETAYRVVTAGPGQSLNPRGKQTS
jgi:hypothetical protein